VSAVGERTCVSRSTLCTPSPWTVSSTDVPSSPALAPTIPVGSTPPALAPAPAPVLAFGLAPALAVAFLDWGSEGRASVQLPYGSLDPRHGSRPVRPSAPRLAMITPSLVCASSVRVPPPGCSLPPFLRNKHTARRRPPACRMHAQRLPTLQSHDQGLSGLERNFPFLSSHWLLYQLCLWLDAIGVPCVLRLDDFLKYSCLAGPSFSFLTRKLHLQTSEPAFISLQVP